MAGFSQLSGPLGMNASVVQHFLVINMFASLRCVVYYILSLFSE